MVIWKHCCPWKDSEHRFTDHGIYIMGQNLLICSVSSCQVQFGVQSSSDNFLSSFKFIYKSCELISACQLLDNIQCSSLKLSCRSLAWIPIDHDYGVLMSLFMSLISIPHCQSCPTKCLLRLDDPWNSCSSLRTWKITKSYLWWTDWLVVLLMPIVISP